MRVYAHRGASREYPENTLASFRRALDLEPHGIELDLHLSADGVPMVIHDETVDRTTDGMGAVSSLSCAALRELDAGNGERIPTLAEVLDLTGDRVHVVLEVKDAAVVPAMLREVAGRPTLRWSVLSFNWDALRVVRGARPDADLWLSNFGAEDLLRVARPDMQPRLVLAEALEAARELRASTLATYHLALDEESLRQLHSEGFACWAWTVNDAERLATLASWKVDAVCTDDPALALTELHARA